MRESDGPKPEEGQIIVLGKEYRPDHDCCHDYEIQIRRHNSLSSTSKKEGFTSHTKYASDSDIDFWTAYWAKKYVEKYGYEDADVETVNLANLKEKTDGGDME